MITPKSLLPGDLIGLVSPAKAIEKAVVDNAVNMIERAGYKVKTGKSVLARDNYFAGTDLQRAGDFQMMLDDPEVRMILCSRGGYGSARIIDMLDFESFFKNPKWVAGYSDITVFHSHLFNLGYESLHGIMPLDFPGNGQVGEPVKQLFGVASGAKLNYRFALHQNNRSGKATGTLAGGNLSILCSLLGSDSDVDTNGRLLFIEETGEDLYRIDRMMVTLKRAGKLENLAGLLAGGFSSMGQGNPPFGKSAETIIRDAVADYDYPVAFGFPAGHFPENYPLVIGRQTTLSVDEYGVVVTG